MTTLAKTSDHNPLRLDAQRRVNEIPSWCTPFHLGFSLSRGASRQTKYDRRDRVLILEALAQALLTLLEAAGEEIGWGKRLKSNPSKRRQPSLFRQGQFW